MTGAALAERLRSWKRQFLAQTACEGAARLAAAWVLWTSGAVCADLWLGLSRSARQTLFLGEIGILVWIARRWLFLPLKKIGEARLLEDAEERFPELRRYLKPAWELGRGGTDGFTSKELRLRHIEEAERLLGVSASARLFSARPSRAAFRAVAAALLVAFSWPWIAATSSWGRALWPWRTAALESLVRIVPGNASGERGRPATIYADWRAQGPLGSEGRDLVLWIKTPGGWRSASWERRSSGRASFTAEELTSPLFYQLTWRDLESGVYTLTPVSPPRLEGLKAAFSQGLEQRVVLLNTVEPLSIVRGTWVSISGKPSEPVMGAWLRPSFWPAPIPMQKKSSGELEARFRATEDGTLGFELETLDGRRIAEPESYAVRALADLPPTVELLSPLSPTRAGRSDALVLAYSAKDDVGLTRVSLLIQASGQPAREIPIRRLGGEKEFAGDFGWDLSGSAPGKIEFRVKAYDGASPSQSGLSQPGQVEVVDMEANHLRTEKAWRKVEEALGMLASREGETLAMIHGRQADEMKSAQTRRAAQWAEAAQRLSQLSQSMEDDAYTAPGLSEEMGDLARGLRQAGLSEVPASNEAAQRGDWKQSEALERRLQERLERSQRNLAAARQLQGMGDVYARAASAQERAAGLQGALEAAASNPGAMTGADRERLRKILSQIQRQIEELQRTISSLPSADSRDLNGLRPLEAPIEQAGRSAEALGQALASGDFAAAAGLAERLSQELAKVQKALETAAAQGESAGSARRFSEQFQKTEALWSEVVRDQAGVLEATGRLEDERLSRKMEQQRRLLRELAREQAVLVSSAAALPLFPADLLSAMRSVQADLESGKADHAATLLKTLSYHLERVGVRFKPEENGIRARLEQAAASDIPGDPSPGTAQAQSAVHRKTALLEAYLGDLEVAGAIPREALTRVQEAQGEQRESEGNLGKGELREALRHEQKALALLSEGRKNFQEAAGRRSGLLQVLIDPFGSTPGFGRQAFGSMGTRTGLVPLPAAGDYAPPRDIRGEIERSLGERRPASADSRIKEYFKRLSQ